MKNENDKNIKMLLFSELKRIWNNRDFVYGTISIAGCKENWIELLNYIHMSESDGDLISSDDIQLLAIALRREYDKKQDIGLLKRNVAAAVL